MEEPRDEPAAEPVTTATAGFFSVEAASTGGTLGPVVPRPVAAAGFALATVPGWRSSGERCSGLISLAAGAFTLSGRGRSEPSPGTLLRAWRSFLIISNPLTASCVESSSATTRGKKTGRGNETCRGRISRIELAAGS